MGTIVAVAIFVVLGVACAALHHKFSLRRRMNAKQHEVTGEEAKALRDIQKDIDRGKTAAQGFIPF